MPRLTFAVLAFRQEHFIDDAVRSALAQQGEPIEIILSDDCSPDGTFERMQALASEYQGPHTVVVRRNAENKGLGVHVNAVMAAARGELVVLMAGDDLSEPDRVQRIAAAWDAHGQRPDLVASHVFDMSHDGRPLGTIRVDDLSQWHGVADWAQRRPYVVGAAHAVTRRLFDHFGPLQPGVSHEDQVNTLRALARGGAITVDAPLVHYRRGGMSAKTTDASPAAFLARMSRRNELHLALHAQWLSDARLLGCEALVRGGFSHDHKRELFIRAQLDCKGWAARRHAFLNAAALPFGWRLRRMLYLAIPQLALTTQRVKAWFR